MSLEGGDFTLKEGRDYTLTYENKKSAFKVPGEYKITVNGKGNYRGTLPEA
ncbi:hypothetical protein NXH67_02295 [Butyrivibrio sp. DSM 10294]|nr:hypothetical protein [Butyrivibrio sp. DSM 10294]